MQIGDAASSAISGIKAATTRNGVAAHNLANVNTVSALPDPDDPNAVDVFTPLDVVQSDSPAGGTYAQLHPRDPAGFETYDPEHPLANAEGLVLRPNVDLPTEFTQMIQAQRSLESNVQSIKAYDEMMQSLLDMKA